MKFDYLWEQQLAFALEYYSAHLLCIYSTEDTFMIKGIGTIEKLPEFLSNDYVIQWLGVATRNEQARIHYSPHTTSIAPTT